MLFKGIIHPQMIYFIHYLRLTTATVDILTKNAASVSLFQIKLDCHFFQTVG